MNLGVPVHPKPYFGELPILALAGSGGVFAGTPGGSQSVLCLRLQGVRFLKGFRVYGFQGLGL